MALITMAECSRAKSRGTEKFAVLFKQNHICPNNIIVAAVRALLFARLRCQFEVARRITTATKPATVGEGASIL